MFDKAAKVYFTTVWHTGTQYFLDGLMNYFDRVSYSHLNDEVLPQLVDYDLVFTTYRDPLRVAASWCNRNQLNKRCLGHKRWIEQWSNYGKLLETSPYILDIENGVKQFGIEFPRKAKNSFKDTYSIHRELNKGNKEYLYRKIPKSLLAFAFQNSQNMEHKQCQQ